MALYIERKKSRRDRDTFYILKMTTSERDYLKSEVEDTLKKTLLRKDESEKDSIENGIASLQNVISMLSQMEHTKYDEEDEVSVIISNSEVGSVIMSLLIGMDTTKITEICEKLKVMEEHLNFLDRITGVER